MVRVVLAARRSHHPRSPNVEIMDRWQRREFVFLYSLDTLAEYAEKLLEHGIPAAEVEAFMHSLARHGELVSVEFFHFRHYPVDADDVMFRPVGREAAVATGSEPDAGWKRKRTSRGSR